MTVEKLIEVLKTFPKDFKVCLADEVYEDALGCMDYFAEEIESVFVARTSQCGEILSATYLNIKNGERSKSDEKVVIIK
jgi:hypothetical protein